MITMRSRAVIKFNDQAHLPLWSAAETGQVERLVRRYISRFNRPLRRLKKALGGSKSGIVGVPVIRWNVGAGLLVLDRQAELLGGDAGQHGLGGAVRAVAEAAAHIRHDHPDLILRVAEQRRQRLAEAVDALGGLVDGSSPVERAPYGRQSAIVPRVSIGAGMTRWFMTLILTILSALAKASSTSPAVFNWVCPRLVPEASKRRGRRVRAPSRGR